MSEAMFSAASLVAIFAWVGLGLAAVVPPGRLRASLLALAGRAVPTGLCVLYTYVLVAHWGSAPSGGFTSLAAVMNLFSVPGKMLGGWVHFLAFDLLVGSWIADDVLASGRSRAMLLVALPATFMYGPFGLLLYLLARSAFRESALDEAH